MELFEDALRSLPDKAPIQDEIDWIRAHPAMMRRSRTKDKLKDVVLEVDDILAAPHGPAPSKSAVAALQHWVNSPNEFFKQLLSQQKKTTTEDPDPAKGAVKDAGIEDIRDMLAKVRVD